MTIAGQKKKVRFLTRNFVNNLPVSVCFTFLMFSYESVKISVLSVVLRVLQLPVWTVT